MAKAACSTPCLAEGGADGEVRSSEGLEEKLGDAIRRIDDERRGGGVEEPDRQLAPVVGINDADPLGDDEALFRPQAAAGVDEASKAAFQRLNGDARGHGAAGARSKGQGPFNRRAQIHAGRMRGCRAGNAAGIRGVKARGVAQEADVDARKGDLGQGWHETAHT